MIKMGTFKGLPVYKMESLYEWEAINSLDKEEIYVVNMKEVYYHDQMIGKLGLDNNLYDFDDDKFELLQKEWKIKRDREKYMPAAKKQVEKEMGYAETQPQSAEKPVKESVEATAAVDNFMATWRDNIDKEIADMKAKVIEMEKAMV